MLEDTIAARPGATRGSQFDEAMRCLTRVVVDGLKHGFFECSVTSEIAQGAKRVLVVRAGKSHRFHIPMEELPR